MKIIYFWNAKYQKGLNLTSYYNIDFDKNKSQVKIIKNKDICREFYGKNISEIIAIVGENGAGKTTIVRELVKHIIGNNYSNFFIEIYEENGELSVYYDMGQQLKISYEEKLKVFNLNDEPIEQRNTISTAYVTNAFDEINTASLEIKEVTKNKVYTPYSILREITNKDKNKYGQAYGFYIHRNIESYANRMGLGIFKSYENYEAQNFLRTYFKCKNDKVLKLDIFKQIGLGVLQFGKYTLDENVVNDIHIKAFATLVEIHNDYFKENGGSDLFDECYLNLIGETYIFFGLNKKDGLNDVSEINELGKIILKKVLSTICKYLEDVDGKIDNIKTGEELLSFIKEIKKIKEINKIKFDVSFLRYIKEYIERDENYKKIQWYKDLSESIFEFETIEKQKVVLLLTKKEPIFNIKDENVERVLEFYNEILYKSNSIFKRNIIFKRIPSSSGERALVNLLGYIDEFLSLKTEKNILLVIDKIDLYLHPRWQQSILKYLINWLCTMYSNKNIQLIITTHSPILLSDFTEDRVIKLKKSINNEIQISNKNNLILGANIQTLFYDNFFMDKGSIGEIAKEKINDVIKYVNCKEDNNKKYINYIVNNIADNMVRGILKKKLNEKLNEKDKIKRLEKIIEENGIDKILNLFEEVDK